jgi:iron complex outermembrane recepter protein
MNFNRKLSYAIALILSGARTAGAGAASTADTATADTDSGSIAEITVTAQRRSESIQNVPITVQALTGAQLADLHVQTFDDLLKYTPNVTYTQNGPGQGNIFMRGLSGASEPTQGQGTIAPFPNVAVYLDDQALQYPGRNVDVYMVDMERVEVLEGPQGTLFGGGAQAGVVRYITNKPLLDVTEGNANASYGTTARGGDNNTAVNATINLPLIADTLAVRATIFDDQRGGYISNVAGTIAMPAATCPTGTICPSRNNGSLAERNGNPVTYSGMRASALWKINEDWDVLISQNYQNMRADGYFQDTPVSPSGQALGPGQIVAFNPAYNKDKYSNTAWTLNGKLADLGRFGALKAVYTGSYLDRHVDETSDYSNYERSAGGLYYTCTGAGASYFITAKPTTCYAPNASWRDQVRNTHQAHEFRVSTSEDNRLRGLFGAYWEKFVIEDNMNYNFLPIPQCSPENLAIAQAGGPDCLSAIGPVPGFYASDPSLRENTNTSFGEDVRRGHKQTAFFTSIDFDLIPKVLTLTAGTRYFDYKEFEEGSEYYSETSALSSIIDKPNGYCTAVGACGFGINKTKSEHGFRSRGNLTWHVTQDVMAYYTYSQGFRPGGFNRSTNSTTADYACATGSRNTANCSGASAPQFVKPSGFDSDELVNNEIGIKSEMLDHRLQVNASAYRMKWSNVQIALFDPTALGITTFVVNGPTYEITGFELQFIGRVTEGLTLQGSGSWNSSSQTNAPCLVRNYGVADAANPTPIGSCITQIKNSPYTNPYGVLGTSPAYSPPMQFNLRARYDLPIGAYKSFVTVGANHIDSMRTEPASFPDGSGSFCSPVPSTVLCRYTLPGYTVYDASLGVAKDSWTAQITANNLTNSNASQNISTGQFIESRVPLRPRVLTLTFGYKF